MTVLNACVRLQVLVGGVDLSPCYTSFAIGFTHLDDSGLAKATGVLELKQVDNPLVPTIEFDLRKLSSLAFFHKGQTVVINVLNSDTGLYQRHPLGTLKIIREPSPPLRDGSETAIQLDVGCFLARFDFPQPDDDKSEITIGTGTSRTNVISSLLKAYNSPAISGTVPGQINYPITKSESSYVQTAAKVALSGSCVLWQNPSGGIQANTINVDNPTLFLEVQEGYLNGYKPIDNPETPPEEVKCVGTAYTVEDTWKCVENTYTSYFRSISQPLITKLVHVRECWDARGKTREVTVQELEGSLFPNEHPQSKSLDFSSFEQTIWEYESSRPGSKLFKVYTTNIKPLAVALSSWWGNLTPTNRNFFNHKRQITSLYSEVDYTYSGEDVTTAITTSNQEPLAAIVPIISYNYYLDPTALQNAGTDEEIWQEISPNEYQKVNIDESPIYVAKPELVPEEEIGRASDGLANDNVDYFLQPVADINIESSGAGGVQPPAPERRPDRYTQEEKQIEGSHKVTNYAGETERLRTYQIDYCNNQVELEAIAKIMSKLLYGKRLGYEVELPWFNDFFNLNTPIPRIDVIERDGYVASYLASGLRFAHDPEKSMISFEGVFLGITYRSILAQQYAQGLITTPIDDNELVDSIQPPISEAIVIEF